MSKHPSSGTWIEIDADALRQNLKVLRQVVAPADLCMVVKGNAYGHGYRPIISLAERFGQRHFAVFSAREASAFYSASDGKSRLQVMGHVDPEEVAWLMNLGAELWISDTSQWEPILAEVRPERRARIHIEVETGMNRTGMDPGAAAALALEAHEHPNVELVGISTHLAGAEDPRNHQRIERQKRRFMEFVGRLKSDGLEWEEQHISSSAAALLDPDCRMDVVRLGISCYGHWPSSRLKEMCGGEPKIRRVLSWKSRVMTVKDVGDGEQVGYGDSFEAEGDTRIAVVAVGYGDGFSRDLSNRGHVLIRGKRASIVGAVNMNMMQVHVGHIPDAEPGDEVILVGKDGDREISVSSFADFSSIVNYELMARLSWEVPRIIKGVDG